MALLLYLGVLAGAYLIGSVNFSIVVSRLAGGGDLRARGSGNAGAMNAYRQLGAPLAVLIFALDVARGCAAVLLVQAYLPGSGDGAPIAAGAGLLLGNLLPLFHSFRGGKGVATSVGLLLGLDPPVALVGLAIWFGLVGLTRRASAGSLLMALGFPWLLWVHGAGWPLVGFGAGVFGVLMLTHRRNLRRLLAGQEPPLIGSAAPPGPPPPARRE